MESKSSKRDCIMKAGVKVFSKKGFHDARMEEIAVEAGIGKGTIYEYFTSKSHLFQEIMASSVNAYYESLDTNDITALSIRERIQILLTGHLRFCIENKELTRIIFWDTEIMDGELKEWGNNMRKEKQLRILDLIKQGIDGKELRQLDTQLLAYIMIGIFSAFWAPIVIDNYDLDPESTARQITDIIFNGIKE